MEDPESGIMAEMRVGDPGDCPVAGVSAACDTTVDGVAITSAGATSAVAEFTVSDGVTPDIDAEPVFSTDSSTRYRYHCDSHGECVCEFVERFDCPASDIHADGGTLSLTFFAPDAETLRTFVTEARDRFERVRVEHLSQSGALAESDPVVVDRSALTDRQREVLATAHRLGYFEHPKRANASDVAAELDVAVSTFSEHLAAAQRKLVPAVLDEE